MPHATDSTNFSDFRSRLREHLDHSKATGIPLLVTADGETEPEAVLLSPAAFDELTRQAELAQSLALLDRSADDIRSGRTRPAKAAIRQIADELNLKLDR
jgi:PHD/YefM family antitoxin component YafN of YafNO toxin-antitoxin module